MISIIICSRTSEISSQLSKNIEETIGSYYELLVIHNPCIMGICEAYNKGASQAKYDNLLFMHDDILFLNQDWGKLLINHLKKENTGVIGLAGSNYVPVAPSAWSLSDSKYTFGNVNNLEGLKLEKAKVVKSSQKVFGLDGVFLATKKSVFEKYRFDENIKGFHGYDTDFSLRVATIYDNYVIWDIFIEHFSKGKPDKMWVDNNIQIRKKIKCNFNKTYDLDLEVSMFYAFFHKYFDYYHFNIKNIKITLNFMPSKMPLKRKYYILNKYLSYLYYFSKIHTRYLVKRK